MKLLTLDLCPAKMTAPRMCPVLPRLQPLEACLPLSLLPTPKAAHLGLMLCEDDGPQYVPSVAWAAVLSSMLACDYTPNP